MTPSKLIVPFVFENEGSFAQKPTIEPFFDIEETESKSVGKLMTPEAAFMVLSILETSTFTVIEEPFVYVPT
jgi:hypothetical protein